MVRCLITTTRLDNERREFSQAIHKDSSVVFSAAVEISGIDYSEGSPEMADETAYCVKCRQKTTMKDTQEVKMKNGRPAIKGACSVCGTGVYKILSQQK